MHSILLRYRPDTGGWRVTQSTRGVNASTAAPERAQIEVEQAAGIQASASQGRANDHQRAKSG
jgi:hypothetical protein